MKYQVWECKIVVPADAKLPDGFDQPPRRAALNAVEKSDINVLACFSGWGGQLTACEEEYVDKHTEPYDVYGKGVFDRLDEFVEHIRRNP